MTSLKQGDVVVCVVEYGVDTFYHDKHVKSICNARSLSGLMAFIILSRNMSAAAAFYARFMTDRGVLRIEREFLEQQGNALAAFPLVVL